MPDGARGNSGNRGTMADMRSVLAIDIGSSAVRAAIARADGNIVEESVPREGDGSGTRFDPLALWEDVCTAVRRLPEDERRRVSALGIAGHVGAVVVDEGFTPLGDAYGWANAEGIAELREALGEALEDVLRVTGRPTLGGGPIATLLALRHTSPRAYALAAHVLAPKDYILARLTGSAVTDYTSAAYYGASSVRDRAWSRVVVDRLDVPAGVLPRQHASTDLVGSATAAAAADLGVQSGLPVAAGGPDGTVGATAVLGSRLDAVVDVAGTTDVLVRVVSEPPVGGGAELHNPYTLGDRWTLGGSTGMTGGAVAWWAQRLGLGSPANAVDLLGERMDAIPPGAAGIRVLPWMSGSRYPRWRPDARAGLGGLSNEHEPAHLLRAVLEGVAFSVRQGVDALTSGDRSRPVLAAGGAARSRRLAQLRADVLGRTVLVCREPDVSLRGAGLLALVASGALSKDEVGRGAGQVDEIGPSDAAADYDAVYAHWLQVAEDSDGRGRSSPGGLTTSIAQPSSRRSRKHHHGGLEAE